MLSSPTSTGRPARPFIIPVFIPHAGCPHRCVFCNQHAISGSDGAIWRKEAFKNHIETFLAYQGPHRHKAQIAFYGGNFLGLETGRIREFLRWSLPFLIAKKVCGLRFSTRPDTISPETLALLEDLPISAVELGVQSMDDAVLKKNRRGHSAADTQKAVAQLKQKHHVVGLQMMVGLPGDDGSQAMATARALAVMAPDFVRIYPTLVIAGSTLARWYRHQRYQPLSLDAAVNLTKKIYNIFDARRINVIRMGLQADKEFEQGTTVIAGPYHPAFGHLVQGALFFDRARACIEAAQPVPSEITLKVNPRRVAAMRGQRNCNIELLKRRFGLNAVKVAGDNALAEGAVQIGDPS